MPFKSEAQRRKFAELVKQGKISQSEADRWDRESGSRPLPDRVGQPSGPKMSVSESGGNPPKKAKLVRPGSRTASSTRRRLRGPRSRR